jgi:hypothetical protein
MQNCAQDLKEDCHELTGSNEDPHFTRTIIIFSKNSYRMQKNSAEYATLQVGRQHIRQGVCMPFYFCSICTLLNFSTVVPIFSGLYIIKTSNVWTQQSCMPLVQ